jgi:hypothetical protein
MGTHMKTTIEISDSLMQRAKAVAQRDGTTIRALVEAGLRVVLKERRNRGRFTLRDASFRGQGMAPELEGASWDRIRDAIYEGRGT